MNKFLARLTGQKQQETETRPALPQEWQPAGGDLIPLPDQRVERVIRRVKVDRNVTIYEQEIVFVSSPEPAPAEPYGFITIRQNHPPTPEQQATLDDWTCGRAVWLGGIRHPADIIRNGSAVSSAPKLKNGRIVLQE